MWWVLRAVGGSSGATLGRQVAGQAGNYPSRYLNPVPHWLSRRAHQAATWTREVTPSRWRIRST